MKPFNELSRVLVGAAFTLTLGACTSLSQSNIQASPDAQSSPLQAQSASLGSGSAYCPPLNKLCGVYQLASRPPIGGTIVPVEWMFKGQKSIFTSLGNTFTATFPSSGYTKFYVNTLFLEVGPLDGSLTGQTLKFALESSKVDNQGNYTFTYLAQ